MTKIQKILIVEDNQEWVNIHKKLLSEYFAENLPLIDICFNARDGFVKALSSEYDFIITDLEMERIAGENYAGDWFIKNLILRDQFRHTKFLIVSGAYNIMDIADKYKVDFIPKSTLINNPLVYQYKLDALLV